MLTALLATFFPAGGWAVNLGKWLLSKLTLRNIGILIALLAIAYGQYRFYNWAQDRQYKEDKVVIDRVTGERDRLQTKYNTYRGAFKTWVKRSETARLALARANAQTIAEIEQRLQASEKKRSKLQEDLKHAIPKYIPPAVDYTLPAGFVRLWNISLEGEPGVPAAGSGGISESLGFDAQAPSGLTLSSFSVIGVENNQECVARGEVIREWQGWYYKSRDQFTKAQQDSANAIPRLPADEPQGSQR
jgi:hypothetical protein